MKIGEERLRSVLEKVADKLEIKQWSYTKDEIDSTIENYFGVLIPVKLIGIGKDGEVEIRVFIKFAPNDTPEELKIVIRQHYEVEVYTYCQLIPIYRRISNMDIRQLIPDCYYADLEAKNEVIVLKDMRCEGYKRYEEKRFLDFDHVCLSLKTLAKFNALSIILKEKESGFDNTIMKPYTDKHLKMYFDYIKDSLNKNVHLFKDSIYENFLTSLICDLAVHVNSAATEVKYMVYGHGDFWKENILYKYKNSSPVQACVIDFQKSRKMSPAQDVLLFLLTSTEQMDVLMHQQYLSIYLDTIHRVLADNGVENVYTADDLKYDMKIVAPCCISIVLMAFSLWFGLEHGDLVASKNTSDNSDMFKMTVTDMLDQLNRLGYITL